MSLQMLGISPESILNYIFILCFILISLFIFIFLGIEAFALGGTLGSIINSFIPMGNHLFEK